MKLAFILFKYFPFGGLQRDFRKIAEACMSRGHKIHVFTAAWEGERPSGFTVTLLPVGGLTNHGRTADFSRQVKAAISEEQFDLVIGFSKIEGLDLYYAADPCYKERLLQEKGRLSQLLPRYRTYLTLEEKVFSPSSKTEILLIVEEEKQRFVRHYHTQENRFHLLPPGISADRRAPSNAEEIRRTVRQELGMDEGDSMLLMVGSGFRTKGLDRTILALSGLPQPLRGKTRLFVIGNGKAAPFEKMAAKKGVAGQVTFLGGREDVPRYLLAADLLVHPAYAENAGMVLLEAMTSGLPVLATDVCGYAFHVRRAGGGRLVPSPFDQRLFTDMMSDMLTSTDRGTWKNSGLTYADRNDLYGMSEKAVQVIETMTRTLRQQRESNTPPL